MTEKRSKWFIGMGITITILAGLGLLGSLMELATVPMLEMQAQMMKEMANDPQFQGDPAVFENMFNFPEWVKVFLSATAAIAIALKIVYLIAGIQLIRQRMSGKKWYLIAAILLGILNIIRFGAIISTGAFGLFGLAFGFVWAIIVEIPVLILVLMHIKAPTYDLIEEEA